MQITNNFKKQNKDDLRPTTSLNKTLKKGESSYQDSPSSARAVTDNCNQLSAANSFIEKKDMRMSIECKDQKHLTEQQRKLVSDISKLFTTNSSKPTKILVRLDQTNQKGSGTQAESQFYGEGRLQKIQVMRFDDGKPRDPSQRYTELTVNSIFRSKEESSDNKSQFLINIDDSVRESDMVKQPTNQDDIFTAKDQSQGVSLMSDRIFEHCCRRQLRIARQVAMTYKPQFVQESSNLNRKIENSQFVRFKHGSRVKEGNFSIVSFRDELQSQSYPYKDSLFPQKQLFIKLQQIQIFKNKIEVREKRCSQLLHANEKILIEQRNLRKQVESLRETIEQLKREVVKKTKDLSDRVILQKKQNCQVKKQLQQKNIVIGSLQLQNKQLLKQNKDMADKLKENTILIYQLRKQLNLTLKEEKEPKEIEHKQQTNISIMQTNITPNVLHPYSQTNTSINKLITSQNITDYPSQRLVQSRSEKGLFSITPNNDKKGTAANINYQTKQKVQEQIKISNCRSHGIIKYDVNPDYMPCVETPQINTTNNQTTKSQRSYGIRKNIPSVQNVGPIVRNLVRVNKNAQILNQTSIKRIQTERRDNKSQGSCNSNLSGKSLSQKIGFIAKPKPNVQKQSIKGMLVDYMLDMDIPQPKRQQPMKQKQRFLLSKK